MLELNTIHLGNNLDLLKQMPDNSVDSVVTDPPYGINFMAKKWDYDVPSVETWQEVLRVLKPGGHALVACGTRTQHRMAVNLEDAGFEIRDLVAWIYGSGFPKSLDISKAIEKAKGVQPIGKKPAYGAIANRKLIDERGWNNIDNALIMPELQTDAAKQWQGWGTALKPSAEYWTLVRKPLESGSVMWYNDCIKEVLKCLLKSFAKIAVKNSMLNQQGQKEEFDIVQWSVENNINTPEDLLGLMVTLQSYITENTSLNIVLSWLNILAEIWKALNTSTTKTEINLTTELKILKSTEWESILENIILVNNNQINGLSANVYVVESIFTVLELKLKDIQTLIAQENALSVHIVQKINMELWTLCRKPMNSTVAENVLKYGVGGINIDGCRVGTEEIGGGTMPDFRDVGKKSKEAIGIDKLNFGQVHNCERTEYEKHIGRFPANVIHDGSEEVVKLFPNTESGNGTFKQGSERKAAPENLYQLGFTKSAFTQDSPDNYGDIGSAARFFYTPKASQSERNEGLYGFEETSGKEKGNGLDRVCEFCGVSQLTPELCHCQQKSWVTKSRKNFHPTVKPIDLMRYLVRMITPKGGIVLEPFAGSGSTCIAAKLEGMNFIGMEIDEQYINIAQARVMNCEKDNATIEAVMQNADVVQVFTIDDYL